MPKYLITVFNLPIFYRDLETFGKKTAGIKNQSIQTILILLRFP
jgi:hypothetical protein